MFSDFFPSENRVFSEIMWEKNTSRVRQATRNIIIRRMRVVCWITKAKYTHSEYVILIAFPLQQWLHESP
jgi:hypothetical protein